MKRYLTLSVGLFLLGFIVLACADQVSFSDSVKIRFNKSATDRRLVDKDATLVLDDSSRKLIVKNPEHPLEVGYDDIQKVVFDVSTRMRGGAMSQLVGGLAGAAIASIHVNHYW